jgi:hypothetical protein
MKELELEEVSGLAVALFLPMVLSAGIAFNARPYSLALFFSLLSTLAFVRWLKAPVLYSAALYIVAFVATIYAHYLFGVVAVFHLFLLFVLPNKNSSFLKTFLNLTALWCFCLLLLIPAFDHLLELASRSGTYTFIGMPTLRTLVKAMVIPYSPLIAFLLALMFVRGLRVDVSKKDLRFLTIAIFWIIAPPTFMFLISRLSGVGIFIPRYFIWQLPGFALLGAIIAGKISPQLRTLAVATCVVGALHIGDSWTPWLFENWRDASKRTQQINKSLNATVFFYSGLTETSSAEWLARPDKKDYLLAPITAYGLKDETIVLPYDTQDKKLLAYLDGQLAALENPEVVLLLVREMPRRPQAHLPETTTTKIFTDYFLEHNYRKVAQESFSDLHLITLGKN